jgi:uncharacterized protein YndB with AHSA1/START domain
MAQISGEIVIDRPIDEVFDFVADERNEPLYNSRMLTAEKVTDGPIGIGTRFSATTNSGRGTADMVIEVISFNRPMRIVSSTSLSNMNIRGTLAFEPVGQDTRLRWSWDLEPKGALKVIGPVVALLGRRNEKAIWASLKAYLEAARSAEFADE